MLTDDPGTPGAGRWEINLAFTVEKDGEERLFEAPLLDVNYGVGDRIQLRYEIPWIVLHEQAETRNGMGSSLLA